MRFEVARHTDEGGRTYALSYDSDDVAEIDAQTPRDVTDVSQPEDTSVKRELGTAHLRLHVTFKPGTGPTWAPVETDKEV